MGPPPPRPAHSALFTWANRLTAVSFWSSVGMWMAVAVSDNGAGVIALAVAWGACTAGAALVGNAGWCRLDLEHRRQLEQLHHDLDDL